MKPRLLKPRTLQKLSLLCLTAGTLTGVALAQTPLNIENPGFELPNTTKITSGWDVSGNDVPGWIDAGTPNNDSGIETPGTHFNSGNCGSYAMGGQPGAYQITTNIMSFGKKYTLTWWGSESWNNSIQRTSLIRADATNTPFASCTEVAVASPAVPQDYSWVQYTLVYTAGNSDAGKYIGIHFRNTGPANASWCTWDDFTLTEEDGDPAPQIATQPVGQNVYEGSPATFTAAATGPDLTYQWKAGAQGSGVYTNVPGATGTTLTIPYAKGTADYVLYVSNGSGSATSDPATLTVNPATYVNGLFNADFELPANGKISGGFDVSGNDVPGWRNAGPNQSDTGIENAGSGYNGSTYAAYLQKGQSGAYQIGTNVLQLGDVVTLSWWARDSWQGLTAKVSLLSASSQEASFDSTTVLASKTNVLDGTWWTQYTITYTAGAGDVGKFLGVALQSADSTTGGWGDFDDFSFTVTPAAGAPIIITQPNSQTGYLAGKATFTVVASGSGLNYQWQAGAVGSGIYTNISNGGQFSGANTASLTISNLTTENGLDYIVTVSNTGGSVPSTPATLTVDTSAPMITAQPAALTTRLTTESVTFTVTATGAVTYQWKAGAVGSGVYTNLSNGGQFSGVNAATLTITNLQVGNQADYVVEVSNGGGSVTSDVANLTIHVGIYVQTFETSANDITGVGWVADHSSSQGTLGAPYWGGKSIWSAGDAAVPQAFYTTTFLENGSIPGQMAFPVIKLTTVSNLTFYVDVQSWYNPGLIHTYFAVQMNWGAWYVSSSELTTATGGQETRTMMLDTNAYAWNQLTVIGTGGTNDATHTVIGGPATADLTGYITGAGVVAVHDGGSWIQMDNFKISGDGFTVLPGLSITPSGSNPIVTWGYGTLLESTNVAGPWTPSSGTSPKMVSPTEGKRFYRLQLP